MVRSARESLARDAPPCPFARSPSRRGLAPSRRPQSAGRAAAARARGCGRGGRTARRAQAQAAGAARRARGGERDDPRHDQREPHADRLRVHADRFALQPQRRAARDRRIAAGRSSPEARTRARLLRGARGGEPPTCGGATRRALADQPPNRASCERVGAPRPRPRSAGARLAGDGRAHSGSGSVGRLTMAVRPGAEHPPGLHVSRGEPAACGIGAPALLAAVSLLTSMTKTARRASQACRTRRRE